MSVMIHGIGVSRGIAIGKTHLLQHSAPSVHEVCIPKQHLTDEIQRFQQAITKNERHLTKIRKSIENKFSKDIVSFIDSHLLMLADEPLNHAVVDIIRSQQCNAEWALEIQKKQLITVFDAMQDEYLKSRKDDVEHVIHLIQNFLAHPQGQLRTPLTRLNGRIIVGDDLTPAETILLYRQNIRGFITELGGTTSHTAILARGMNIPAIVAASNVCALIREGEEIILDGDSGMIAAGNSPTMLKEYRNKQKIAKHYEEHLLSLKDLRATSKDGVAITLMANIELPKEAHIAQKYQADGIGLYRTEFLYLNEATPDQERKQYQTYTSLIRAMQGKVVTIRTFDLGAEKSLDDGQRSPLTTNPALGLRAIRHSLKYPDMFLQQIRAILRAATHGPVRIMIPMLTNLAELQQALQLIDLAKEQLRNTRKKFVEDIPIGGMIEVPAAALAAKHFAQCLDFLSIGTNDLIQYTLAIDRIDDEVNYLYDPLHPSILRLIKIVLDAGKQADIPVAMCGEMASNTKYTKLLLGLGLNEFSVHPNTLLEVKQVIRSSTIHHLKKQCHNVVNRRPQQILALLDTMN